MVLRVCREKKSQLGVCLPPGCRTNLSYTGESQRHTFYISMTTCWLKHTDGASDSGQTVQLDNTHHYNSRHYDDDKPSLTCHCNDLSM